MGKVNVVPKPKKKDYSSQTWATEWINSQRKEGEPRLVSFDRDGYIDHLERYCTYLEREIKELEYKLSKK